MLEQIAYESPGTQAQKQQVYVVGDLESLSASVLYTDRVDKAKFINNGIENIRVDSDGDAFKFYSDLINNSLSVGIQPNGEDHEGYEALGIFNIGPLVPGGFGSFSGGSSGGY